MFKEHLKYTVKGKSTGFCVISGDTSYARLVQGKHCSSILLPLLMEPSTSKGYPKHTPLPNYFKNKHYLYLILNYARILLSYKYIFPRHNFAHDLTQAIKNITHLFF